MIESYFVSIEAAIQSFPSVSSYTIRKKIYNTKQGFIHGDVLFDDAARLEFAEVIDVDKKGKKIPLSLYG